MNPSGEIYHYDEKYLDYNEVKNRISIASKKYGGIVERFLVDMLAY
jgi:hypothetical protein